jgi:CheY-like chemotaxis protein
VRLLVCEDEALNRLYLVNRLKHRGYTVDVAADGEEAFRKAVEDSYGAVLMDLGMPKISGLEATRRIRSWEEEHGREQVPVIALTAHTYEEDIRKTREAGMNDFISKPISEVHLARALSAWVE